MDVCAGDLLSFSSQGLVAFIDNCFIWVLSTSTIFRNWSTQQQAVSKSRLPQDALLYTQDALLMLLLTQDALLFTRNGGCPIITALMYIG